MVESESAGTWLCTICCARKRRDRQPLPALERYLSERIAFVSAESRRLGAPMLILSGKFGLLAPHEPIPWYDELLTPGAATTLVPKVASQLAANAVAQVVFYARPRSTPGWEPYYEVLERACELERIPLRVQVLGPEFR